jgi:uncharacterized membrane protein YhaH (DUF805 family)
MAEPAPVSRMSRLLLEGGHTMEYMFMPFKRYFDFSGRSRRKEYWMFVLLYIVLYVVAGILDVQLGFATAQTASEFGDGGASASVNMQGGMLSLGVMLVFFIPLLACAVRRCHDNDKSGWFVLIPIYGAIIVLFLEGTRGPNRFGPDPKGGTAAAQTFN